MTQVFETERLTVRLLAHEDFAALFELCSSAEVMKYVGNLEPYTEAQTRQVILKCLRSYGWYDYGGWALILKENGEFAGYGGLEFVVARKMPELFYIISQSLWGQGLATEFARAAVHYAFTDLKLKRLGTSFDPRNIASMQVAGKVGFRYSHEGLDEFSLPAVYYELESEG